MQSRVLHGRHCRFTEVNWGIQGWRKKSTLLWKWWEWKPGLFEIAETWWNPNCWAQTKIRTSKITFKAQGESVFRIHHTQPDLALLGRLCVNSRAVPLHPTDILVPDRSLQKNLHLYEPLLVCSNVTCRVNDLEGFFRGVRGINFWIWFFPLSLWLFWGKIRNCSICSSKPWKWSTIWWSMALFPPQWLHSSERQATPLEVIHLFVH